MKSPVQNLTFREFLDYYESKFTGEPMGKKQILLNYHPDKLPQTIRRASAAYKNTNIFVSRVFDDLVNAAPLENISDIRRVLKKNKAKLESPLPNAPRAQRASPRSPLSPEDQDEPQNDKTKIANCIRQVANWSEVKSVHMMDRGAFIPEVVEAQMNEASPKLKALFENIAKLDAHDMKHEGKLHKHMIFTDVGSSSHSTKIIASAFVAKGFTPIFHGTKSGLRHHPLETLQQTKWNNFAVLTSKTMFDSPMNAHFKKQTLEMYNQRPENVHGENVRFIILSEAFKEGIDLFDVKYVHLFEPLTVPADERQAIGRGTRFCGQKGLMFHPQFGWPLHVYRYELSFNERMEKVFDAKQLMELYLRYTDIDMKRVVFAAELDNLSALAAVDNQLTTNIHTFKINHPPPLFDGGALKKMPVPPPKVMKHKAMQRYIQTGFKQFAYPRVAMKNGCLPAVGGNGDLIEFSPTQDFVRHYFQPASAYKGMLLYHAVGTGKTCTAIATATTSFDKEGYTILWVTRHSLKSDIWKNMFGQVCNLTLREKINNGALKLPHKIAGPMKYMSRNWVEPISYKQFSNMLLKKNKIYEDMVCRNCVTDPLKRTLVIIDEAHKLYAPNVVGNEKPRMDILEEMIQNSYKTSGDNSVRLLLMTATPYTQDGMEMINLMNLLRPEAAQLPREFSEFSKAYLDDQGFFTAKGKVQYMDDMSGYISYLNRSSDARNFAYPVMNDVFVPLSEKIVRNKADKGNKYVAEMKSLNNKKVALRAERQQDVIKANVEKDEQIAKCSSVDHDVDIESCRNAVEADFTTRMGDITARLQQAATKKATGNTECMDKFSGDARKTCKADVAASYKADMASIRDAKSAATKGKTAALKACSNAPKEGVKACVSIANATFAAAKEAAQRKYVDNTVEIDEMISDVKNKNEETKAEIKAITTKINEDLNKVFTVTRHIKFATKDRKVKLAAIKKVADKAERAKMRKALAEDYETIKRMISDVKTTKDAIAKYRIKKNLMAEALGTKFPDDMSQETMLHKKCGL
jgi:superfamily II DNA or RNA helicase